MDEEFKKFLELDRMFRKYESMKDTIGGTRIALEFIKAAARSQNVKVIQQGWCYCCLLKNRVEILDKIDSSEEEVMSLAAEIFEKLPIEVNFFIITEVGGESENRIFFNNPEMS